jgi:hypothetical protein
VKASTTVREYFEDHLLCPVPDYHAIVSAVVNERNEDGLTIYPRYWYAYSGGSLYLFKGGWEVVSSDDSAHGWLSVICMNAMDLSNVRALAILHHLPKVTKVEIVKTA